MSRHDEVGARLAGRIRQERPGHPIDDHHLLDQLAELRRRRFRQLDAHPASAATSRAPSSAAARPRSRTSPTRIASDDPSGLATAHHIFVVSAGDGEHLADGLPAHPETTPPPG